MRFFLITVLVALAHLAISGVLFFVALAGIGAMTAEEARTANSASTALSIWNCGPEAANQYLADHAYSPLKTVTNTTIWTQEDQTALEREIHFRSLVRDLIFLIWPVILGSVVAGTDSLFRISRMRGKGQAGG